MLFNSIDFAIFLPVIFAVYWIIGNRSLRLQNLLIVVASYVFYGWWDWRFLSLLLFSTVVDYCVGRGFAKVESQKKRKLLLAVSLCVNLGLLGFFKYFDFFAGSFVEAFTFFGYQIDYRSLGIVLPVGISFYTFQTLSYSIDLYRRKIEPSGDFVQFAAFVSFFPQLVAGPIERASHLLPQFRSERVFSYHWAMDGSRQILWGLFKKVVIADNCARHVDVIFANSADASGSTLVLGAVFFAFQIYGDFSGYSDIAIGTSRLFGFDLKCNFAYPYFSRDIAEFWRRWHISLSTWFRDYLYIPLGGSRGSLGMNVRNVMIVFVVSGLWHGANWTFIVWGALNALYFLPLLLAKRNRTHLEIVAKDRMLPCFRELTGMATTFGLVLLGWIFFRAENLTHAFQYISGIFSPSLLSKPDFAGGSAAKTTLALLGVLIIVEWIGRSGRFALAELGDRFAPVARSTLRWVSCYIIAISIIVFGVARQEFIYFQF
ncbi:MBOAT family O-acyltransferase [Haloferula sp.]|uniref:MBOAT family O-acyltransferase n=1 Tax=Haloferula sp. TaxID=2497595 RepID=UPI003C78ABCF